MKKINFDKMQGLGNDYVYLTCMESLPDADLSRLAVKISDRHFGVGGDGMVIITRSDCADFRMIMFNNDGSEAQMCGNASRCIGRLVYEKGLTSKTEFTLQTGGGVRHIKLNLEDGKVKNVSVNMGKPVLESAKIPVVEGRREGELNVQDVALDGHEFEIYCVSMGNPHGVIYQTLSEEEFTNFGPRLEKHSIWPEKANIEFVEVLGPHEIKMRVWERGTGETLACGTGACASAVASILSGRTENNVTVRMKGGDLEIGLNDKGEVIMTGDAEHVAAGEYYYHE